MSVTRYEYVRIIDGWRAAGLEALALIGAATVIRFIVARVLAAIIYLLIAAGFLTARLIIAVEDAHARGVERVRAYEARGAQ